MCRLAKEKKRERGGKEERRKVKKEVNKTNNLCRSNLYKGEKRFGNVIPCRERVQMTHMERSRTEERI